MLSMTVRVSGTTLKRPWPLGAILLSKPCFQCILGGGLAPKTIGSPGIYPVHRRVDIMNGLFETHEASSTRERIA